MNAPPDGSALSPPGSHFGHLRPNDVDTARVRAFVQAKLSEGLSAGTVRILVALLSALFTDLVEEGKALANPARGLPRATRRLVKPTHDPRTTPFIEKLDDVRRIYLDLPERELDAIPFDLRVRAPGNAENGAPMGPRQADPSRNIR